MSQEQIEPVADQAFPFKIADRYEVTALLGRGGMASVYRAWDGATRSAVALKKLTVERERKSPSRTVELFEREFHTLVQLAHPRIVRALDYGVEDGQPYYTLELLDGGDLRELAPLPWQDICTVAYEVCSALSLLHSRGLVHRDLTPRNIRRTEAGQAKLIDFGLMSAMGATTLVAGTPPFVAPEIVRAMALDGRSDLYSLGVTLYYALTKRHAYPARTFDQLQDAWRSSPARPSSIVAGIPRALDELLLALIRVDGGSRPKSAAEVMERLLPLLPAPPSDELRAARAHIVAPKLVGRDAIVARFRKQMIRALRARGGGFTLVGPEGSGRSRLLDAFVLEAKLVGATTIRAGRDDASRPFAVAASLVQQLHRAAPAVAVASAMTHPSVASLLYPTARSELAPAPADVATLPNDHAEVHSALRTWLLEFSLRRPLAIAVDDLDAIDDASAALLAALTLEASTRRLAYLAVIPADPARRSRAVEIVQRRAAEIAVEPLSGNEIAALLGSVFGNAPHIGALSSRFAPLSAGRPRECMMLAQYLVDAGVITYGGGSWTLPEEVPDALLPADLQSAFALRFEQLGSLARHVAALVSENLVERLARADVLMLELAPPVEVDTALGELMAGHLVVGDTSGYAAAGPSIARLVTTSIDAGEKRRVNDELARLHERAGRHTLLVAYHAMQGSNAEAALARIARETPDTDLRTIFVGSATEAMGEARMAVALDLATRTAESHSRPKLELQSLRAMLASTSARGADPIHFYRVAEAWLEQAKRDSGYDDWLRQDASLEPMPRAMMAVSAAIQRHAETPEAERGQTPQEGIQQLVAYVLFAIAVSARVLDRRLQASLPEILVPFAPLNPMVLAILSNSRATNLNGEGRREHAQTAFEDVLAQLESVSGAELRYVDAVRAAVCYALAASDTTLGILNSNRLSRYAELQDRNHRVSALFLQKLAALQQGDWELAERYRQEAEHLSLETNASSMFSTLGDELEVHAMARDLTGLRHVRAGVRAMAERFPGFVPMQQVADAHYLALCSDFEGALSCLQPLLLVPENALEGAWPTAGRILAVSVLTDLGRDDEALSLATSELARCEARGMRYQCRLLSLSLARLESKLGRHEDALARALAVVEEQTALGVAGLQLGKSYDALARIAMNQKDPEGFHRFAALACAQYKPGQSSVLGALYERLIEDGRQAGLVAARDTPLANGPDITTRTFLDATSLIAGCENARERAERALGLLCDGDPPTRGHLLVSSSDGLVLAASNTPCPSVSQLVSFASDCLQRENRASLMETSELSSISSVSLDALPTEWRDGRGTDFEVVLLGTTLSDDFYLAGVALLQKTAAPRATRIQPLADAITRALLLAGDAVGFVSN